MAVGRTMFLLGTVLLFHAGYSTVQHKSFLKLAEAEYVGLPNDVFMECIFASVLCIAGVFTGIGKFKDVDLKTEINSRSYDSNFNRQNFMTFNHRGSMLMGTASIREE